VLPKYDGREREEEMTKPYVLIVLGSPRKKGNSAILAKEVAKGAKAEGAMVETLYLHGMNIHPCSACEACQESLKKDCIIDDDMKALYPKARKADAIVYATPVYWFTVTAQTKLFIDRCYALGVTKEVQGETGPDYVTESDLAGKKIGVVLTYGDTDPFSSGGVNALRTFQDMFRYIGSPIVGMVYGSAAGAGEIESNTKVMKEAYEMGRRVARGI
jgi:multimeric flavodoxin WrbA